MQEDIAGIGRHQGWHGKYAMFSVELEMSEDFRGTPLVRMEWPVTAGGGAVLYLCILEKYCGFGKMQSVKKQGRNSIQVCKGCRSAYRARCFHHGGRTENRRQVKRIRI